MEVFSLKIAYLSFILLIRVHGNPQLALMIKCHLISIFQPQACNKERISQSYVLIDLFILFKIYVSVAMKKYLQNGEQFSRSHRDFSKKRNKLRLEPQRTTLITHLSLKE
jgi:hypothetical protein